MFIFSIFFDAPFIRTAFIKKRGNRIEVRQLSETRWDENNPDPLKGYHKNLKCKVVSALCSKDYLLQTLQLKIPNKKHIEEAISFQAEATTHLNPIDILSVPLIQKREKNQIETLLFTVPKDALAQHLTDLKQIEVDPDAISTNAVALSHFARWKFPDLTDAIIINLASQETACILIQEGKLKKSHYISVGIEHLLSALLKDRKRVLLKKEIEKAASQIDLLLLKPGLNPQLSSLLDELKNQIAKVLYTFGSEKKPILFTGKWDTFIHLKEFLADSAEQDFHLSLEEQTFAVPLGLALEQTNKQALQLRRKEFFPKKNWRKLGFFSLSLLLSSLLLSSLVTAFTMQSFYAKKLQMLHSLRLTKTGPVEEKLETWIRSIEKNNREYPYILQAPNVTEVLSWLTKCSVLQEIQNDPIDIKEIRYQLLDFPKVHSTKEPYLAKVEMDFAFNNPMHARKFHEFLREENEMVDSNREISWDVLDDGYRCSFYLKNRGPYVF